MGELKPCPFCGGEAIIKVDFRLVASGEDDVYLVGCRDYECRGFVFIGPHYMSESKAIEAWSKRVNDGD